MTTVSVLTPSYQYEEYLPDALASVRLQTGLTVEHVVQDGGSTDGSLLILEAAGPPVKWDVEPDSGIGDALNKALRRATGSWIAWLNADEFFLEGALAEMLRVAERSRADVVFGDVAHVDEHGRLLRLVAKYPFDLRILKTYGPLIPSCSMLIRRETLGDEPWNADIRGIAEFPMYLKLVRTNSRFVYTPKALSAYRVHGGQDSLQPHGSSTVNRDALGAGYDWPYPPPTQRGRWLHRALKVRSGAYLRELAWLRRRGEDMRWFARKQQKGSA
jgi:glycosyltransferase involved in cell wall biosynthesis